MRSHHAIAIAAIILAGLRLKLFFFNTIPLSPRCMGVSMDIVSLRKQKFIGSEVHETLYL